MKGHGDKLSRGEEQDEEEEKAGDRGVRSGRPVGLLVSRGT